jgi:membrane protease YdiL (CAAX protease family)
MSQPAPEATAREPGTRDTPSGPIAKFAMGEVVPGALPPLARLVLFASLILGWFFLIQRFGEGDIYAVVGPYACVVAAVSWAVYSEAVSHWLHPTWKAIWTGVAIGIGMTAATYPIYAFAAKLAPSLADDVRVLYSGAHTTTLGRAMLWIFAAACAEELLFRGAWPTTLRHFMPAPVAFFVSLVTYSLAQAGTGSWIVVALAFACGTFWTLQRYYTGSLLSPLISHLIWSQTVLLLYPVT